MAPRFNWGASPGIDALAPAAQDATRDLRTTECSYYTFESIKSASLSSALAPTLTDACDGWRPPFVASESAEFDGFAWSRWTSEHWEIPIAATIAYLVLLRVLTDFMARRDKFQMKYLYLWNLGLSLFSCAGVVYCVPRLLAGENNGLFTRGPYASVCSHASVYGFGKAGFFVAAFIYSKLAELFDTLWLVLGKRPVILLHWYHHFTVLLYCWHSYSSRIGTGLWFAAMNYTVHSIMYFYYFLTQWSTESRKLARRFAQVVTTLQISQMVVGIAVTVSSVLYIGNGHTCYVSLVNSAIGLAMYSSYFWLFLKLYREAYGPGGKLNPASKKAQPPPANGGRPIGTRRLTAESDTMNLNGAAKPSRAPSTTSSHIQPVVRGSSKSNTSNSSGSDAIMSPTSRREFRFFGLLKKRKKD